MKITGTGNRLTELEKAYICKFYHVDGPTSLAYSLERRQKSIAEIHQRLKRLGFIDHYIRLWDRQFEEGIS